MDIHAKRVTGGPLIETLASFGDVSLLNTCPVPKLFDYTLAMSYSGIETWFKREFYEKANQQDYKTTAERGYSNINLQ